MNKKIISITLTALITLASTTFVSAKTTDHTYSSAVVITAEAANLEYNIITEGNNSYLIENETNGPILVNDKTVIAGKSSKQITTSDTIIVGWYE